MCPPTGGCPQRPFDNSDAITHIRSVYLRKYYFVNPFIPGQLGLLKDPSRYPRTSRRALTASPFLLMPAPTRETNLDFFIHLHSRSTVGPRLSIFHNEITAFPRISPWQKCCFHFSVTLNTRTFSGPQPPIPCAMIPNLPGLFDPVSSLLYVYYSSFLRYCFAAPTRVSIPSAKK
jgi:hypothetical protein